jgi:hypothetical protein
VRAPHADALADALNNTPPDSEFAAAMEQVQDDHDLAVEGQLAKAQFAAKQRDAAKEFV